MNSKSILFLFTFLAICSFANEGKISSGRIDPERIMEKVETYMERHSIGDVKAVFEFYLDLVTAPKTPENCLDGEYIGESIYDDYKYKHRVKLTIKDQKIIGVEYDELKSDGHGKKNDAKYNAEMKKVTHASPADAYPAYETQLKETQDVMKVDAVTGATYSLFRFRSAVVRALRKAKGK